MSRYRYNRQVSPPAPFVHVSVRAPVDKVAAVECPAQVNTAADLTVIPARLVDELKLDQLSDFPILGVNGHLSTLPTYLVQIQIRTTVRVPVSLPRCSASGGSVGSNSTPSAMGEIETSRRRHAPFGGAQRRPRGVPAGRRSIA